MSAGISAEQRATWRDDAKSIDNWLIGATEAQRRLVRVLDALEAAEAELDRLLADREQINALHNSPNPVEQAIASYADLRAMEKRAKTAEAEVQRVRGLLRFEYVSRDDLAAALKDGAQ